MCVSKLVFSFNYDRALLFISMGARIYFEGTLFSLIVIPALMTPLWFGIKFWRSLRAALQTSKFKSSHLIV